MVDAGIYCLTGGYDRTVKLWRPLPREPTESAEGTARTTEFEVKEGLQVSVVENVEPIQTYTQGYAHPISSVLSAEANSGVQLLMASSHKTLAITDLTTTRMVRKLHGHTERINALACPRNNGGVGNGDAILSASYDGTVAIWDGRSRDAKPIQCLREATDSVSDVCIIHGNGENGSSSNSLICTASVDGWLRSYDLRKGCLHADNINSPITSICETKDGRCLVVSCLDGIIRTVSLEHGQLISAGGGFHVAGNYGLGVGVLGNDQAIVTGSEDGSCVLYDPKSFDHLHTLDVSSSKPTCYVSPHPTNPSILAVASHDGTTSVWTGRSASQGI